MKMRSSLTVSLLAVAVCFAACGDDDGSSSSETEATDATDETDVDETAETEATAGETDGTETEVATDVETEATDAETEVATDAETDGTEATDVENTDTDEPDAGAEPEPEGFIGAEGGTIENEDGVKLVIPPDSIDPPSEISLAAIEVDDDGQLVSTAWDFQPDGVTFDPPAMLTLPFDTEAAADTEVAIAWLDAGEWIPLTECTVADAAVTCAVEHFTTFGVVTLVGEEPDGGTEETDTMETDVITDPMETEVTDSTDTTTDMTDVGTDPTGTCEGPPCWTEVGYEDCIPDVAETCQTNIEGVTPVSTNVCYSNGVKAQVTGLLAEPLVMTFKKVNGDACYSLEFSGATTSTYSYVWKNAAGNSVMTATVQASNTDIVTYQCDGSQYVVDYSTEECSSQPGPASSETAGCAMETCEF